MNFNKYKSSTEVLNDIDRELKEIGSDKLKFLWVEIRSLSVRAHELTGSKGKAKKLFIELVELNQDILIIDGVLAIYEAFRIERDNWIRPSINRGKLKRANWQNIMMTKLEQEYIN